MNQVAQLNSGLAGKFWVKPQNFNGERDLIGHALAGRLPCAPKLQIGRFVIIAVAVLVVNILSLNQGSAKNFLHDKSVLVNLLAASEVDFSVTGGVDVSIGGNWSPPSAKVATFAGTEPRGFVIPQLLSGLSSESTANLNLSAILTLENRRLFVHEGQFTSRDYTVKEIF